MASDIDPTLAKIGASIAGSAVSLKFIPGATTFQKITNFVAGVAASTSMTGWVSEWLHIDRNSDAGSGVAFLIGCLGVVTLMKVHEGITNFEVTKHINDLLGKWKR